MVQETRNLRFILCNLDSKICTMHLQEIYLLAKYSAISSVKWYIGNGLCSVLALPFQVIHLLASRVPYKIYMHP